MRSFVVFAGIAFVVTAAGILGGCATLETSDDRVNPDKPLWFHRPGGAIDIVFVRELTAASRSSGEPYELGRPEIDPPHGRVFVGTSDHGLYALRAGDGSTLWRFETLAAVQSEPLYDAELDVVYFGSNDGAVYAVHASDGQLVWRYETGAEVRRKPVLAGEALYFANHADNCSGSSDGRARREAVARPSNTCLGYRDQRLRRAGCRWRRRVLCVLGWPCRGVRCARRQRAVDAGRPVGRDRAGARRSGPLPRRRHHAHPGRPSATGKGRLRGQLRGRRLRARSGARRAGVEEREGDRRTDLAMWREAAHDLVPGDPGYIPGAPPVPRRELLLASSGATGLWALDTSTGRPLWRLPVPEGGITAPVPVAGALLIGTTRYGAFLISPLNGRPIDGFDLGSGFSQTPGAFGTHGFLLTNAGTFIGLQVVAPKLRGPGSQKP